jgi:hypothetical protein
LAGFIRLHPLPPDLGTFLLHLLHSAAGLYSVPSEIKHVPAGKLSENQDRSVVIVNDKGVMVCYMKILPWKLQNKMKGKGTKV